MDKTFKYKGVEYTLDKWTYETPAPKATETYMEKTFKYKGVEYLLGKWTPETPMPKATESYFSNDIRSLVSMDIIDCEHETYDDSLLELIQSLNNTEKEMFNISPRFVVLVVNDKSKLKTYLCYHKISNSNQLFVSPTAPLIFAELIPVETNHND